MPNAQDVLWFKSEFQPQIEAQIAGTPFSVDMLTAFACQETGGIWPALRRQGLPTARILELCVGDTIDASPTGGGRRAFPKNKAELLAAPGGDRMFQLARQGLVDMAEHIRGLPRRRGAARQVLPRLRHLPARPAVLQDPARLLPRAALRRLRPGAGALRRRAEGRAQAPRLAGEDVLSDNEMAAVAIAYNTGGFNPARGLKQGYFDGTKYYGENYLDFLRLAKSVQVGDAGSGASWRATASASAPHRRQRRRRRRRSRRRRPWRRRHAAKKATAKKAAAKKAADQEGATKRPKKTAAKKAASKQAKPPKKPAPKKAAPKKAVAKKSGATKAAAKKAARRR